MRSLTAAIALLLGGCSAILDFSGDLADGGPEPDGPAADADPLAPDAGPDPHAAFEPNDSMATAPTIEPGMYGPISVFPMGDHDFYKFTLAAPSDVVIQILFEQTEGDLDLKLYDGAMAPVLPSSTGTVSNEQITHTVAENGQIGPGDYYIEAYGYNNVYINERYTLVLTVN